MPNAREIREQLLRSFRAELSEHIQTITSGLLQIEQAGSGPLDQELLNATFRAAHSLKGAARAMGVTAIEQLAHAQENILDGLRRGAFAPAPEMFTVFYQSLDAVQAVQSAYEAGETTPPTAALAALMELENLLGALRGGATAASARKPVAPVMPVEQGGSIPAAASTVRVGVEKLDALMASLNDLLVTRIRLEQRREQIAGLREQIKETQQAWERVRGPFNRLLREKERGLLSLHRPISVDAYAPEESGALFHRAAARAGAGFHAFSQRQPGQQGARPLDAEENPFQSLVEVSKDIALLIDYLSANQGQIQAAAAGLETIYRQVSADTTQLSLIIDSMDEDIKRLRLLPFHTITTNLARMARDLAQQSGKEAALTILGGDSQLDKRVLEELKDPLIHLLRNAIDHGIEPPEQRLAAGKPRAGQITLSAERSDSDIVVRVADDGAGLDVDAIRQVLSKSASTRRAGMDAEDLSENDLVDAIFSLGVTTSRMLTDVSGRGVGLSVVRKNVEALHGRIGVDYWPGQGTSFSLILPISLTGMHGLLVRAGEQTFAIPLDSVERTLALSPGQVFHLDGRAMIRGQEQPVPLARLSEVLELPAAAADGQPREQLVVILSVTERFDAAVEGQHQGGRRQAQKVAFIVDALIGEQEIVIKDLGGQLTRVAGVAGATVLGSGEVVLVLNAADLVKLAAQRSQPAAQAADPAEQAPTVPAAPRSILVVDDSITTRTLEKNILEAAGFQVRIAVDGCEALELIRASGLPDMVITDIIMPNMDGFELTRVLKRDERTARVPVILVTSLDSAEDKKRGMEVQADAYIVKSSFDQANLLETIAQLM